MRQNSSFIDRTIRFIVLIVLYWLYMDFILSLFHIVKTFDLLVASPFTFIFCAISTMALAI